MSKFINTSYVDGVESLSKFYNTIISNNFYKFSDEKPVKGTYYNLNKDYSSLDPGSKLSMDYKEEDTSLRWNVVFDMVLYSFPKFEMNTEAGEFGLEAATFEGETYILPNTIVPYEGDYFEIDSANNWLFIVKDVQRDTLENGYNIYKITFKLDAIDRRQITDHIIHRYRYFENREGTNLASVVRCEDFDNAKKIDGICTTLKNYYKELFYNEYVQTFIYQDLTDINIYDPMMIEFLIRNKVLENNGDRYIHVMHQCPIDKTFSLDYDQTFFRAFESKDLNMLRKSKRRCDIMELNSYGTTFQSRFESYYKTFYKMHPGYHLTCIDDDLYGDIIDHNLHDDTSDIIHLRDNLWNNIIIKYFYDEDLTEKEIASLYDIKYQISSKAFYMIPLILFCLDKTIEKILK